MSTITPFVKRMRVQGGTMFTFSSACEDIGLNINERNNVVKMSHYALLNIPSIAAPSYIQQNRFNILAIPGAIQSFVGSGNIKDSKVLVSESFQNYALNLEANLINASTYQPNLLTSVAERVFWKWLKETGAIRWQDSSIGYFEEETDTDSSIGYNSVVKCIGQISAGSIRTDNFGTYNETYVLVPTSYGQTKVFFKQVEDENYYHGISIVNGNNNILGRETYIKPHPDALDFKAYYDLADSSTIIAATPTPLVMQYDYSTGSWTNGWWWTIEGLSLDTINNYYTDISTYLTTKYYNIDLQYGSTAFRRSMVDCMSIVYDLDELKNIPVWNNPPAIDSTLTFDKIAIENAIDDTFNFNAILIYYSIYNKTLDKVLATNLLGILFLDAPSGLVSGFPPIEVIIPSITKIQSGPSGFGTSYSFRINIKSDNMMDDTQAVIYDESTSAQTALEDFSEVFNNLERAVNILNQQTGNINYITQQYNNIQNSQTQTSNLITDLQNTVNDITQDITGTENTVAMFATGADPIVDSSIYMKNGKLGFFTNDPSYSAQFDVSVKVMDLIIQNAIRDTSGNILLGYGSPLQIGSSENTRIISFWSGTGGPYIKFGDGSIYLNKNVIIDGSFYSPTGTIIGGNGTGSGDVTTIYVDGSLAKRDVSILSIYNNGLKNTIYVKEVSLGTGLSWAVGKLYVDVSIAAGGVDLAYVDASLIARDDAIAAETAARNTMISSFSTSASTNAAFTSANASTNLAFLGYATNASVNAANFLTTVSLGSYATNASIATAAFAKLANPTFTGTVIAPTTASSSDNTTKVATNQFVQTRVTLTDTSVAFLNTRRIINEASIGSLTTRVTNHDTSIASLDNIKANTTSPIFTTSFGIGNWKFKLSGNNLVLTYNDASLFKFMTDGSMLSAGDMESHVNII